MTLDYGTSWEIYEGRFRSEDRITGLIERGTTVRNIGTLEFCRIGRGVDDEPAAATVPPNGGIAQGGQLRTSVARGR